MDKIESYQFQSFPVNEKTKNNLCVPNKVTEISIHVGDGWVHPNQAQLYMNFEVIHDDGSDFSAYDGKTNVKLIDNYVAKLFDIVTIKKGNNILSVIEHPFISSSVLIRLTASISDKICLENCVMNNGNVMTKENEVLYPLELFGGFFKNYKEIMWEGDLTVCFTWSSSASDCIFRWETGNDKSTLPKEGKIVVKHMEIRVPTVKYEPNFELELREMMLNNPKTPISFYEIQTIEIAGLSGKKNIELDITNYYNSVEFDMPYWIFVVFQTNRKNNQLIDSSSFDHVKLSNIYVKNGRNEMFPEERWNIEPPHTYLKAYDAFREFKIVAQRQRDVDVNPYNFINNYPIYVINMTHRKNVITTQKTTMKLCATFNDNIPDNTLAYIIMYAKKNLTYDTQHRLLTENF